MDRQYLHTLIIRHSNMHKINHTFLSVHYPGEHWSNIMPPAAPSPLNPLVAALPANMAQTCGMQWLPAKPATAEVGFTCYRGVSHLQVGNLSTPGHLQVGKLSK
jgi:hypothetical protein